MCHLHNVQNSSYFSQMHLYISTFSTILMINSFRNKTIVLTKNGCYNAMQLDSEDEGNIFLRNAGALS
jgi:hypothetical protein